MMRFSLLGLAVGASAQGPTYMADGIAVHRFCDDDYSGYDDTACTADPAAPAFSRHEAADGEGWDIIEDCSGGFDSADSADDDDDDDDRFCIEAPAVTGGYACHGDDVNTILEYPSTANLNYGLGSIDAAWGDNFYGQGGCRRVKADDATRDVDNTYMFDQATATLSFCRAHPKHDGDSWNFGVDAYSCVIDETYTVNPETGCWGDSPDWGTNCDCNTNTGQDISPADNIVDNCATQYADFLAYGWDDHLGIDNWGDVPCCPVTTAEEDCGDLTTEGTCNGWVNGDTPAVCMWELHPWHPHAGKGRKDGSGKCKANIACSTTGSCGD